MRDTARAVGGVAPVNAAALARCAVEALEETDA